MIKADPLQDAIAVVMRILAVALVVGVAIRRIWAIAGAMAEVLVTLFRRKEKHEEPNQEDG